MTTQEITQKIIPVLKANDVIFAALFGSRARGEEKADSDIDILVRFGTPKSLFDLIGLEQELSQTLNSKVDVVTERSLHPLIKNQVIQDLKPVYGQR